MYYILKLTDWRSDINKNNFTAKPSQDLIAWLFNSSLIN